MLLTRDKNLVDFLRETGEETRHIVLEEDFIKRYGRESS